MTSKDRKEKRYQNRKHKREQKKQQFLNSLPSYEEIFTFEHLYHSFWLCRREVGWKPSLQIYQQNLTIEIVKLLNELHSPQGFKSGGFIEFNICERGKMRHIKSVNIKERIVQRCFCDYYLVPLLTHNLIYDNGASLKNKGVSFTLNRLNKHLKDYYKSNNNSNEGYILLFDFSNYFDSINHKILYDQIDSLMLDEKCRKLFHHLIDMFGDVGLGLGSQVSQVSAVAFPNKIDHFFLQYPTVKKYARYMDDGYAIFNNKEEAKECFNNALSLLNELKLNINLKKVKIIKLKHSFPFLKKRFYICENGKIIKRLARNKIYKHFRKIKKLILLCQKGKLHLDNVVFAHNTWKGQLKPYNNKKAINNIHKKIGRLLNNERRYSAYASHQCSLKAS